MTKITNDQNNLYNKAVEIIEGGRKKIVESIYNESTKSYFLLGKLIVEEEQAGENRAEYGKEVIKNLSKKLTLKYGRGFSVSTLKDCRKFYQKSQTLSVQSDFKLPFGHYTYLIRFSDEEMKFYEQHAIKENLSLRKLKKAVETNTMLRLLKDRRIKARLADKSTTTQYPQKQKSGIICPIKSTLKSMLYFQNLFTCKKLHRIYEIEFYVFFRQK